VPSQPACRPVESTGDRRPSVRHSDQSDVRIVITGRVVTVRRWSCYGGSSHLHSQSGQEILGILFLGWRSRCGGTLVTTSRPRPVRRRPRDPILGNYSPVISLETRAAQDYSPTSYSLSHKLLTLVISYETPHVQPVSLHPVHPSGLSLVQASLPLVAYLLDRLVVSGRLCGSLPYG
jgi:hypothetical protein